MRDLSRRAGPCHRLHLVRLRRTLAGGLRQPLLILWTAVVTVLLVGCVNIAGLLLTRSAGAGRRSPIAWRWREGAWSSCARRSPRVSSRRPAGPPPDWQSVTYDGFQDGPHLVLAKLGRPHDGQAGLAAAMQRAVESVDGVPVGDPSTFALAAGIVLLTASAATLVPSLRILRLDPIRALRG